MSAKENEQAGRGRDASNSLKGGDELPYYLVDGTPQPLDARASSSRKGAMPTFDGSHAPSRIMGLVRAVVGSKAAAPTKQETSLTSKTRATGTKESGDKHGRAGDGNSGQQTPSRVERQSLIKNSASSLPAWLLLVVMLAMTLIIGTHSLLLSRCKDSSTGKVAFHASTAVLLQELLKYIASLAVSRRKSIATPRRPDNIAFIVPALLYAINNNLAITLQAQMDSATFQILGNMKTLSAIVFSRLFTLSRYTLVQWLGLSLLITSGILGTISSLQQSRGVSSSISTVPVNQTNASHAGDSGGGSTALLSFDASSMFITSLGVVGITAYCAISGFAGMLSTFLLQLSRRSVFRDGISMYKYGVMVNGAVLVYDCLTSWHIWDGATAIMASGGGHGILTALALASIREMFKGFTPLVGVIILTQALNGIMTATIMKHLSVVARLFVAGVSLLVAVSFAALFNDLRIPPLFVAACLAAILALILFNYARIRAFFQKKHS